MTTTTPASEKKIPVKISLSLEYQAKPNMTMAEFTAEADKANKIVEDIRKHGSVKGTVKIGSQKFKV